MAFENSDVEPEVEEAGPPPEESNNRTFLIVAGILGGIMLLTLICIVAFALLRPLITGGGNQATQAAEINLQNTEIARGVTQTAVSRLIRPTSTATTRPTDTIAPTNTRVVAEATATQASGSAARTATVAALLTQAATAAQTMTPEPTSTRLPTSGFADDVGAPGLLAMAVLLVGVIFLARRLRTAH